MAKQRDTIKKEHNLKLNQAHYQKMSIITMILIVGFFTSIVYHYIQTNYLNKPYPYNTIFFLPNDFFNDFYNFYKGMASSPPKPYSYHVILPYFPITHLFLYLFTFISVNLAYLLTVIAFYTVILYQNSKALVTDQSIQFRNHQILLLSFFSYPFLFVIDRGNVEIFLYIALYFFFYFYYQKKNQLWSTSFLVFAINMKLYPAVLLILLISDKKYKQLFYTILYSLVTLIGCYYLLSLLSIVGLKDTIKQQLGNIRFFDQAKFADSSLRVGHTLWGIFHLSVPVNALSEMLVLSKIYVLLVIFLFLIVALYVIFVETIRWKKVTLLILPMITFPFISFDYTLIHIYFPLLFFIQETQGSKRENIYYAILFSVILIPVNYIFIRGDISISTIIYPATMMIILLTILLRGLYYRFVLGHNNKLEQLTNK